MWQYKVCKVARNIQSSFNSHLPFVCLMKKNDMHCCLDYCFFQNPNISRNCRHHVARGTLVHPAFGSGDTSTCTKEPLQLFFSPTPKKSFSFLHWRATKTFPSVRVCDCPTPRGDRATSDCQLFCQSRLSTIRPELTINYSNRCDCQLM